MLDNTIQYQPGETPQRTLVLIKPDNFRFHGPAGQRDRLFLAHGLIHRRDQGAS